jgi:hypothetical protein
MRVCVCVCVCVGGSDEPERRVWGVQNPPPPRNSDVLQSQTGLQIERKMFSVLIPTS